MQYSKNSFLSHKYFKLLCYKFVTGILCLCYAFNVMFTLWLCYACDIIMCMIMPCLGYVINT